MNLRLLVGSRFAQHWLINLIRLYISWPRSITYTRVQNRIHSPLEWKRKHISITSAVIGWWRFSLWAAERNYLNLSITCSCGSTPLFWEWSIPLIHRHVPFLLPSKFLHPSSFGSGQSTQNGVVVRQSPLLILFWSEPNSERAPDLAYSISVLL